MPIKFYSALHNYFSSIGVYSNYRNYVRQYVVHTTYADIYKWYVSAIGWGMLASRRLKWLNWRELNGKQKATVLTTELEELWSM